MNVISPQLTNGTLKYPKDNGYYEKTLTTRLGWRIYLSEDNKPISLINAHLDKDWTGNKVYCQAATFNVYGVDFSDSSKLYYAPISGVNKSTYDSLCEGEKGGVIGRYIEQKYGYNPDSSLNMNRRFEPCLYTINRDDNLFSFYRQNSYWSIICFHQYETIPTASTPPPELDVKTITGTTVSSPYNDYSDGLILTVCVNFTTSTTFFLKAIDKVSVDRGYGDPTKRGYLGGSYGYRTLSDYDSTIFCYQAIDKDTIGKYLKGSPISDPYFCLIGSNSSKPTSMLDLTNGTYYYYSYGYSGYLFPSTWTGITMSKKHNNINYYVHQVDGSWVTDFTIIDHDYINGDRIFLYNSGFTDEFSNGITIVVIDEDTVRGSYAFDGNKTEHSGTPANSCQYCLSGAGTGSMAFKTVDGYVGVLSKWL